MKTWKTLISLLLVACMCLSMACTAKESAPAATEPAAPAAPAENAEAAKPAEAPAAPAEPIYVALDGPMTGDNAQYGLQFQRGVETFFEEYNAAGGYNGAEVIVDIYDDKNEAAEAVNVANKIAAEDKYVAMIGPYSSTCAFAMCEVLEEAKILSISPCISHPDYVTSFNYTIRIGHVNVEEAKYAANYMVKTLGKPNIASIYINNDWGLAVHEKFVPFVEEIGGKIVSDDTYIAGQTKDFTAILTKMKATNPDCVYLMANYAEAGPLIKQIRELGMKDVTIIVGTPSYKSETLKLAGDAVDDNVLFLTSFTVDSPNEKTVAFRKLIKEKYDVEIDNMIVRAYDACDVLMTAIENAGGNTDADVLVAEILKLQDFEGVSGTFSYKPDRNTTRAFIVCKSDGNGSFKYFENPTY